MDPNNPVVQLCVAGMKLESENRFHEAAEFFERAWKQSTDDYEMCIAAHYVARHQKTASEAFHWNQEALDRANKVGDDRVREFYPSLYLNIAKAYEELGNRENANRFYELADVSIDCLPEGRYRAIVRDGVAKGFLRSR